MKKVKPPIIDKDLESKAFRVFLKLIGTDYQKGKTVYEVAWGAIGVARIFEMAAYDFSLDDVPDSVKEEE